MKNLTKSLLLFTILGLINCTTQKEKLDSADEIYRQQEVVKLNNILRKYEVPSQKFKISFDKSSKIKGKNGTAILVNPNDLETVEGKPITETIEVELKEFSNQSQLFRNNAQTVSDGKILVSGGAYYINMTSKGQQLKLKDGKVLTIEFPKLSDSEMSLFYGQKDSLGKIDWQKSETKFAAAVTSINIEVAKAKPANVVPNPPMPTFVNQNLKDTLEEFKKSLSSEEKTQVSRVIEDNSEIALQVYKAIEIKQLGWINCDRFLEIKEVTNLKFEFNTKDSIVVANVYLVFKDINSVMESSYFSFKGKTYNSSFDNIPVGSKVMLVAISEKKGKVYLHKSNLIIGTNKSIKIDLHEIAETELNRLFE